MFPDKSPIIIIVLVIVVLLARVLFIRMRAATVYDDLVQQYGRGRLWLYAVLFFAVLYGIRVLIFGE